MKIFFLSAITAVEKYKKEFEEIISITASLECDVVSGHVLDITPNELESKETSELKIRYEALIKKMKTCDAVIFEGTIPSTGCGHFLTVAIQNHIPVLFLSQHRYTGLMIRDSNRILKVKNYDHEKKAEMQKIIKSFINFAKGKKLRIRFNLMIDESIENHLSYISKEKNISRADYLRNLIYDDIEKRL